MKTSSRQAKRLPRAQVAQFFDILAARIEPKSELHWDSPLDLTVAVVLSAQCTDRAVNKVTAGLFRRCHTPQQYLELGEEELQRAIRSIGLYRNKAKSVIGICRRLREDFDDRIPETREQLMSLPGVGRKSANVILNVVFGHPTLAVDTHVFRVANRTGMARGKTPDAVEQVLLERVPSKHLQHAHHYLILHGRYTCTARAPACPECPVKGCCNCRDKTGA